MACNWPWKKEKRQSISLHIWKKRTANALQSVLYSTNMTSRNSALNKFLTFERPVFSKAVRVCNFLRGGRKEKKGAGEMITTVRTCVVAQVKRKRETSNQPFLSLTADRVKIQVRRKESFLSTALSETSSMRREEELRPYTCCHEAKKCSIHT